MISSSRSILYSSPEDAEVLEHRRSELVADLPRALTVFAVEQLPELALRVALRRLGNLDRRVRQRPLGSGPAGAPAERDRLHQRVAAEAVRAVHRDARALAGCVEAGQLGEPVVVGLDAAHVVVRSRPDRDRVEDRIDARVGHRELARPGQPLDDPLGAEVAQVEEDRSR